MYLYLRAFAHSWSYSLFVPPTPRHGQLQVPFSMSNLPQSIVSSVCSCIVVHIKICGEVLFLETNSS